MRTAAVADMMDSCLCFSGVPMDLLGDLYSRKEEERAGAGAAGEVSSKSVPVRVSVFFVFVVGAFGGCTLVSWDVRSACDTWRTNTEPFLTGVVS